MARPKRLIAAALVILLFSSVFVVSADQTNEHFTRQEINLTGDGWKLWKDTDAKWKDDKLYLPNEMDLSSMPINAPTNGWESMYSTKGIDISIPANVEEYYGNGFNNYKYHGVSWFWKTVDIPSEWQGKTVRIKVEKTRLRAEIYVNEELAGYDIVSETPYEFDISPYLNYGETNKIAVRITNPGGRRGWEDFYLVKWGDNIFPAGKDFGGIGGEIKLVATDNTYVGDVFVKNLLPVNGRSIEVKAGIYNKQNMDVSLEMTMKIISHGGGNPLFTETYQVTADSYKNDGDGYSVTEVSKTITVPEAELWDIDTPNLYYVEISIDSQNGIKDVMKQTFGFRTFEVKEVNGVNNLYFNGKRIRHRSAIDWGFYAQGGNYTTDEMAKKSVQAAKDLGQNGINFHRQIGESLVLKYADEMGLYMYQEPGGFHVGQGQNMTVHPFAVDLMKEKITRMVIRDRNHPSLIWYNLCNEDNADNNPVRMWALEEIAKLDGTTMVTNSSGDVNPRVGHIKHIRPYETEIRKDFMDHHTVNSTARFNDDFTWKLNNRDDTRVLYWGESGCFTGPSNWYKVAKSQNEMDNGRVIYDFNIYQPLYKQLLEYFDDNNLAETGSRAIKSPADITEQAGRGLMYSVGRLGQSTMIINNQDGYAINGWSSGPQLPDSWDSAMLDEGRNIKGPAEDYAYWVRELQIVVRRQGGKYFKVGDIAKFDVHIIIEGKLPSGTYKLKLRIKDGAGNYTSYLHEKDVEVQGGDIYAQEIFNEIEIEMGDWKGGYITIDAKLYDSNGADVADGVEQVLLGNRPSFKEDIDHLNGAVINWFSGKSAILETGAQIRDYSDKLEGLDYILAGSAPNSEILDSMLKKVHDDGSLMVVKFDKKWAELLFEKEILSYPVIRWGGTQTSGWKGDGWGYIDYFVGDQSIPSGSTIGTNGWEVPSDPVGFYPFRSDYPTNAYGAYMARNNTLNVLIGTIYYGEGKILLSSGYAVDQYNPFNDMLFYNLISMNLNDGFDAGLPGEIRDPNEPREPWEPSYPLYPGGTGDIRPDIAERYTAEQRSMISQVVIDEYLYQKDVLGFNVGEMDTDIFEWQDKSARGLCQWFQHGDSTATVYSPQGPWYPLFGGAFGGVFTKLNLVVIFVVEDKDGVFHAYTVKNDSQDAAWWQLGFKDTGTPLSNEFWIGNEEEGYTLVQNFEKGATNVTYDKQGKAIRGWTNGGYYEQPEIPIDPGQPGVPEDPIYGDVNGDGEVTNVDLILLRRYIAGIDVLDFNAVNADVNGDSTISNVDLILLSRYIAGIPVELGPQ